MVVVKKILPLYWEIDLRKRKIGVDLSQRKLQLFCSKNVIDKSINKVA